MGRYLVLAPADSDDHSLFEELGRLAAVVVPRRPRVWASAATPTPSPRWS